MRAIIYNMTIVIINSAFLIGVFLLDSVEFSSPVMAEITSIPRGEQSNIDILRYLLPVVKRADIAGRIYYDSKCDSDIDNTVPFPAIEVHSPSDGSTGVAAAHEIFENNKNVYISQNIPGLIEIKIGDVSSKILDTKIAMLNFEPMAQYNYTLALAAVENSREVRMAMLALGLRLQSRVTNEILVQPTEGLPHLPNQLTNTTMDQALDLIALKFKGVVIYGSCIKSQLFSIDFAGGVYSDDLRVHARGSGLQ